MMKVTKIIEYQTAQDGKDEVQKGYNPGQIISQGNKPATQSGTSNMSDQQQTPQQPAQGSNSDDKK